VKWKGVYKAFPAKASASIFKRVTLTPPGTTLSASLARMGRRDISLMTTSVLALLCKGGNWWSSKSPSLSTKFLSHPLKMMSKRAAGQRQHLWKEKQVEEALGLQQMEREGQQRLQEKKRRAEERKKEEEQQKQREEEACKAAAMVEAAAAAQVVSPGKPGQQDRADPSINDPLASMMQGDMEAETTEADGRDETQSPVKSKQKKSYAESATTAPPAAPAAKAKGATTSFNSHIHKHQHVIAKASIKLSSANPTQEFIVNLQELLKNGQLVDKFFAFCPVKPDGGEKKIHEASGVPTNMTMLGAHFKITSNGRNPFEKQKMWGNKAKKDKEELKDPVVYFSLAIATDEDPKKLIARIVHKWQCRGGILLQIKELQSFESNMVLTLFNIYMAVPKKLILDKFLTIMGQAQSLAQEEDCSEFIWDTGDLPKNSTLPAMEIHLQNPKLPGQDTSNYNKLSWRVQANCKVYHVECNCHFTTDIKQACSGGKGGGFCNQDVG
jgi:hypothetical protein